MVHYVAKEYQLFNLAELEDHLSRCPDCRGELADLRELDRTLSRLPRVSAPAGFAAGLKDSIRGVIPAEVPAEKRWPSRRFAFVRDLVAAAAVTLALFWTGGNLFDSRNVNLAGQKLDTAVQTYVSFSGDAVSRAYDTVGTFSEQLFTKEWNSK